MPANPKRPTHSQFAAVAILLIFGFPSLGAFAVASSPSFPESAESGGSLRYVLDLRDPESHLVGVSMTIPNAEAETEIQFPAWNALYQIRNFIRNAQELHAECDGLPLTLTEVDLETRRSGPAPCGKLDVNYRVYANGTAPFGSALDSRHAFLNLAMLLFYLPRERHRAIRIRFVIPPRWKLATLLDDTPEALEFSAPDYDTLVDSPVEAGNFAEYSYRQPGATYRVIVHAEPSAYSEKRLLQSLERITATETEIMQDVSFRHYTFIFHFISGEGGGGMEHANGTAISLEADSVRHSESNIDGVAAHEFFHLWNVKRIRAQGLEPIDYVHGNDTSCLWFAEGVTSTYGLLSLVRSGLVTRRDFYGGIAGGIQALEARPARRFQSVAESGREAWLEKYADYSRPERSISYYNKGELLGYLLDLAIRHATRNSRGLDDLMRALNRDFAQQHRFFTDADLRAEIRRLAPEFTRVDEFFRSYVEGTVDLDYSCYLGYAGLQLERTPANRGTLGFVALQSFTGPVTVDSVASESEAARAGLRPGDTMLKVNGQPASSSADIESTLRGGQKVKLEVRRGHRTFEIKLQTGRAQDGSYRIVEVASPSADQLIVREGWLSGRTGTLSIEGE